MNQERMLPLSQKADPYIQSLEAEIGLSPEERRKLLYDPLPDANMARGRETAAGRRNQDAVRRGEEEQEASDFAHIIEFTVFITICYFL